MATTAPRTAAAQSMPPLLKLGTLCFFGAPGAGKTLAAITNPFGPTLVVDSERSSVAYREFFQDGVAYWDCTDFAGMGQRLMGVEPGKFQTLVIDSGTWLSQAIVADTNRRKPGLMEKQGQIFWSHVDQACESLINRLHERFSLIILTALSKGGYLDPKTHQPKLTPGCA